MTDEAWPVRHFEWVVFDGDGREISVIVSTEWGDEPFEANKGKLRELAKQMGGTARYSEVFRGPWLKLSE